MHVCIIWRCSSRYVHKTENPFATAIVVVAAAAGFFDACVFVRIEPHIAFVSEKQQENIASHTHIGSAEGKNSSNNNGAIATETAVAATHNRTAQIPLSFRYFFLRDDCCYYHHRYYNFFFIIDLSF